MASAMAAAHRSGGKSKGKETDQFNNPLATNPAADALAFDTEPPTRPKDIINDEGPGNLADYDEDAGDSQFTSSQIFEKLETEKHLAAYAPGFIQEFLDYAISPQEQWRLYWDMIVLVLVVYSSVMVPYDAAFMPNKDVMWFDTVVDICFYADIVLNFWTGFDRGYEIVMEKDEIVTNYVYGWFSIDLVATIQWDKLIGIFDEELGATILVKMLALIKILRLLRASRLIDRLTANWTTHSGYIEATKFFIYVIIVGHILGCFFFLWPVLMSSDSGYVSDGYEECAQDGEASDSLRECLADPDCDTRFDGKDWFYQGRCMQGSWRQGYDLEAICLPGSCGLQTGKVDDSPIKMLQWVGSEWGNLALAYDTNHYEMVGDGYTETLCPATTARAGKAPEPLTENQTTALLLACLDSAEKGWNEFNLQEGWVVCPTCMRPVRLYIDSMYWSLTTMTTIGYGDRGPATESEVVFVMFAEVFGLAFFALLLTQINNVSDIMSETAKVEKDIKDGVLQFLKNQDLDEELITDTVKFLNFRTSSFSGNAYADDDPRFEHLSDGLKSKIRSAVYMPVLKKIAFFGWDEKDDAEEASVKDMFDRTDTDGSGKLDKPEIRTLFENLDLSLTDEQFDVCFKELDREQTGEINFYEFSWWWFLTKYGKPRISSGTRCPMEFLEQMCTCLRPQPFAIHERLVKPSEYGMNFIILLSGKLRVLRPGVRPGVNGWHPDHQDRVTSRDRFVDADDREPMVGFASCLTKAQWDHVRNRTDYWAVDAEEYTDTLWVSRKNILQCFRDSWPKGQTDMVEVAYYHYEVELIQNSVTDMDGDDDGVVDHEEFVQATPKELPHGFSQYAQAKQEGKPIKAGEIDMSLIMQQEIQADAEELLDEETRIHKKVGELEVSLETVGRDISQIKGNMEKLMTHLKISPADV